MASNYATGNWVGATSRLTQVGTVCVETSGAVEVAFNISRSVVSYLSPSLRDPRGRGRCSSGLCSLFLLQPSPSLPRGGHGNGGLLKQEKREAEEEKGRLGGEGKEGEPMGCPPASARHATERN